VGLARKFLLRDVDPFSFIVAELTLLAGIVTGRDDH
jgi:hypothetical protein